MWSHRAHNCYIISWINNKGCKCDCPFSQFFKHGMRLGWTGVHGWSCSYPMTDVAYNLLTSTKSENHCHKTSTVSPESHWNHIGNKPNYRCFQHSYLFQSACAGMFLSNLQKFKSLHACTYIIYRHSAPSHASMSATMSCCSAAPSTQFHVLYILLILDKTTREEASQTILQPGSWRYNNCWKPAGRVTFYQKHLIFEVYF